MEKKRLLFLIYDGVANSVFESLVLAPAKKYLALGLYTHVDIVSFESDYAAAQLRVESFILPAGLSIILFRRLGLVTKPTLFIHAPILAKFLQNQWYDEILVRGPLAAYVLNLAIHWFVRIIDRTWPVPVTIQARGLAAQEALFSFNTKYPRSWFRKKLFKVRVSTLAAIEQSVYQQNAWLVPMKIVAVSEALKAYLVNSFGAQERSVVIEEFDLVDRVDPGQVALWRDESRGFLKIPGDAIVYGYSGSCKQWQCARETIEFIAEKIAENENTYGFIATTEVLEFEQLICSLGLASERFIVRYVPQKDLLPMLSVLDYGLLLRHSHVVNWVSRPTKALEYIAVGVPVIHNKTVKWLIDYDENVGVSGSEITPQPRQISLL